MHKPQPTLQQEASYDSEGSSASSGDAELEVEEYQFPGGITVVAGVNANEELSLIGKEVDQQNHGGNFLKIIVENPHAHILQFSVRQVINKVFAFSDNPEIKPIIDYGDGYMKDLSQPGWVVDKITHGDLPFYDSDPKAMFIRTKDALTIYDRPTISMEDERILFCSFIMVDVKVIGTIKWSRQQATMSTVLAKKDREGKTDTRQLFYSVKCDPTHLEMLPEWAIRVLIDENKFNMPAGYDNVELIKRIKSLDLEQLYQAAKKYLIAPDPRWSVVMQYPLLFQKLQMPPLNLDELVDTADSQPQPHRPGS